MHTPANFLIALFAASLMTACGGGGSSSVGTDSASSSTATTGSSEGSYPVVDTGQVTHYDNAIAITAPAGGAAFYGQDAQYSATQASYSPSRDATSVYDNVTQLTWMSGPNTTLAAPTSTDKMTYTAALTWVAAVNAMNYGGYGDWRLPTIKELYSLMDFSGSDIGLMAPDTSVATPFIDTAYFRFGYGDPNTERYIDAQYLSSTAFVAPWGMPMQFGLNLADGRIKGYDLVTPGGNGKTFYVQLVRGRSDYGINIFTNNGDGTISDAATGLMWAQDDSGIPVSWQDGLAWVAARNAANHLGHNDWRMPNAKELQSIVDYSNAPDLNGKPAIDTAYFNSTAITNENGEADYGYYWTSTTHVMYATTTAVGTHAVYIPFGRALGWNAGQGKWVDVHGAGCQRSDPKTAPPYAFATRYTVTVNGNTYGGYALGPQLDAIRGLNYVRLVRG